MLTLSRGFDLAQSAAKYIIIKYIKVMLSEAHVDRKACANFVFKNEWWWWWWWLNVKQYIYINVDI